MFLEIAIKLKHLEELFYLGEHSNEEEMKDIKRMLEFAYDLQNEKRKLLLNIVVKRGIIK